MGCSDASHPPPHDHESCCCSGALKCNQSINRSDASVGCTQPHHPISCWATARLLAGWPAILMPPHQSCCRCSARACCPCRMRLLAWVSDRRPCGLFGEISACMLCSPRLLGSCTACLRHCMPTPADAAAAAGLAWHGLVVQPGTQRACSSPWQWEMLSSAAAIEVGAQADRSIFAAAAGAGWVAGVLLLVAVTVASAYGAWLLATLHQLRDGTRTETLNELAFTTLGKAGRIYTFTFQFFILIFRCVPKST